MILVEDRISSGKQTPDDSLIAQSLIASLSFLSICEHGRPQEFL